MHWTMLLSVTLALAACTQMATMETKTPIAGDLGRSKSLAVTVTSKTAPENPNLKDIERRLVERLTATGRFREVSAQSSAPDAARDLSLVVNALALSSDGVWNRSFFGEGEVKFDVTLLDRATGQTLGAGIINSEASRGVLWSSASGRALDEAIDKVVQFVAPL